MYEAIMLEWDKESLTIQGVYYLWGMLHVQGQTIFESYAQLHQGFDSKLVPWNHIQQGQKMSFLFCTQWMLSIKDLQQMLYFMKSLYYFVWTVVPVFYHPFIFVVIFFYLFCINGSKKSVRAISCIKIPFKILECAWIYGWAVKGMKG